MFAYTRVAPLYFAVMVISISVGRCSPIKPDEEWSCMEQWLSMSGLSKQTTNDRLALTEVRKYLWAFQLDEAEMFNDYHRQLVLNPNPSVRPSTLLEFAFARVKMNNVSAIHFFNCIGGRHVNTKCSSHPPCKHGSRCRRHPNEFTFYCNCSAGFSGMDCSHELNGCESNPCQHGGACTDTLGKYRCACRPGFEGHQCEKRWLSHKVFKPLPGQVADLAKMLNKSLAIINKKADIAFVLEQVAPILTTMKQQAQDIAKLTNLTKTLVSFQSCENALCQNGGLCVDLEIGFTCQCGPLFTGRYCQLFQRKASMSSCQDYHDNGQKRSGTYFLRIGRNIKQVWCDMTTGSGGWTVIQRRKDGSVNFFRNWNDYKIGFGNVTGEFWLGNDWIHRLTSRGHHELRIDFNGGKYAEYSRFAVAGEGGKYRLTVSGFSGNVDDKMANHNNQAFTTKDSDNDNYADNCASRYSGAWWYKSCYHANLNGLYQSANNDRSILFGSIYPTFVEMKIR